VQQLLNAGPSARRLPPSVLATCVIPWDRKFRFQEDTFRNHVRLVSEHMTKHLYIFGTAGEGYAVTDPMFREIATVFYDQAQRSNVTPMLGVISHSLGTVIERVEFGLIMGYRQFQISFPSWGIVSDTERDVFFREICGRFPQGKFLHYNVSRSGRVLMGAEYGRLAGRHRNLVAIKFTSSKRSVVHEIVRGANPVQCFLTEPAYVLAREIATCGLLVSLSGVRLELPRRFIEAQKAELSSLGRLAMKIDGLLEDCVGATSPAAHMDGAYEKLIARAHGARLPLRLLPPFEGANEEGSRRFLKGLRELDGLGPSTVQDTRRGQARLAGALP
jgi:dihydrodipicolinate synthase/N-acetylneuraminate lyase